MEQEEKLESLRKQKEELLEAKKILLAETNSLREELDVQANKVGFFFTAKEELEAQIATIKAKIVAQQQRLESVKNRKNELNLQCNEYSNQIKVTLLSQTNAKKEIENEILQIYNKTIEENELRGRIMFEKDKLFHEIEIIKRLVKDNNENRTEFEANIIAEIEKIKSQITTATHKREV